MAALWWLAVQMGIAICLSSCTLRPPPDPPPLPTPSEPPSASPVAPLRAPSCSSPPLACSHFEGIGGAVIVEIKRIQTAIRHL